MNASDKSYTQKVKETTHLYYQKIKNKYRQLKTNYPRLFLSTKIGAGLFVLGLFSLFLIAVLVYKGAFGALPTYAELQHIQNYTASEVYAEDDVLLGKYYVQNRINADFDEISPNIINALVATEDARFFEHRGIDYRALMRVAFKTILLANKSSGGGSTLSQQLAKNLYPRKRYKMFSMLINKMKEGYTAHRLEKIYAKEDLLKLYLNTVSFSENIFGIKVAARRFFDKSPDKLSIEEAALLVGTLKGPGLYNPITYPERTITRRNTVLSQMSKYGYLSPEHLDSIQQIELVLNYRPDGDNKGLATYFREHLRLELEEILEDYKKLDGTKYNLYTDGLKIYTTVDATLQRYAEEAVAEHLPKLQKEFNKGWKKGIPWKKSTALENAVARSKRYKNLIKKGIPQKEIEAIFSTAIKMRVFDWAKGEKEVEMSPIDSVKYYLSILNTGFLAIEPSAGLIKAWVGGINHKYFQYDHVKSNRQVGSTFKPIVYAQALQSGMLPCEYTENRLVTYEGYENWTPHNSDGKYGGVYSLEGALSNSVNTTTVEIAIKTGIDSIRRLARNMGIMGALPEGPAIALGAGSASLMDMMQVYGTFANRGKRPELFYLKKIETADGKTIVAFKRPNPKQFPEVLNPDHADMMIRMLSAVVDKGTARRLRYQYGLHGAFAGKTGTTQNQSDGWFIGFNTKIVAGAWVGTDNPHIHFKGMKHGQGAASALPIWARFMKKVTKNNKYKSIKKAKFKPMRDTISAMMECPPFLEEMPIFVDYWEEDYQEILEFNQALEGISSETRDSLINVNPRHHTETLSEYSERIQRKNEKMYRKDQRRQKRKEFWNKLLFKKEQ